MVWVYKENGVAQRGKSTARQYMTRRVRKHSKRGKWPKKVRRTFKMLREV